MMSSLCRAMPCLRVHCRKQPKAAVVSSAVFSCLPLTSSPATLCRLLHITGKRGDRHVFRVPVPRAFLLGSLLPSVQCAVHTDCYEGRPSPDSSYNWLCRQQDCGRETRASQAAIVLCLPHRQIASTGLLDANSWYAA